MIRHLFQSRILPLLAVLWMAVSGAAFYHINAFAGTETALPEDSGLHYVALVNFSDTPEHERLDAPTQEIQTLFNGTDTPKDNSLRGYLSAISRGALDYESTFAAVTVPGTTEDYRNDTDGGQQLFEDVLLELSEVLLPVPDIDTMTLYLNTETRHDTEDAFWPHQTTLSRPVELLPPLAFDRFLVIPSGIQGMEGSFLQILCHETLHQLGADDLYHYSSSLPGYESNPVGYDKLYPVGAWDIMGTPFQYDIPVQFNIYDRVRCGLLPEDTVSTAVGTPVTLSDSYDSEGTAALRFGEREINGGTEAFYVEYRGLNDYDACYRQVLDGKAFDPGYVIYRVRESITTGNRLEKNGDAIVFARNDGQPPFSLDGRRVNFDATFSVGEPVPELVYSDGSPADFSVCFEDEGVTVREHEKKQFRFTCEDLPVAGIVGTVTRSDGTSRTYVSDESGTFSAYLQPGDTIVFSGDGFVFTPDRYVFDGDLSDFSVIVASLPRSVVFHFDFVPENLTCSVNGEDPVPVVPENGILTLDQIENGDRIVFFADGKQVEILITSDRSVYDVAFRRDLFHLDPYWLAIPVGVCLLIVVLVICLDYRKKH